MYCAEYWHRSKYVFILGYNVCEYAIYNTIHGRGNDSGYTNTTS